MEEKEISITFEIGSITESFKTKNVKTLLVQFLTHLEVLYQSNDKIKAGIDYLDSNRPIMKNKRKIFGLIEEIYKTDKLRLNENVLKDSNGHKSNAEVKSSKDNLLYAITAATRENTLDTINLISQQLITVIEDLKIFVNNKIITKQKKEVTVKEEEENIYFNKIIFGPTGTGKSFLCDKYSKKLNLKEENILRVTFHPEYSYFDFMGQYKPVVYNIPGNSTQVFSLYDENSKISLNHSIITYSFVPGIFLESIIKANSNPNENVVLIIEEINRGNCAAIFGDTLQLLDRDEIGNSNYKLTLNADMKRFLIDLNNSANVNLNSNIMKNITNEEIKRSISSILTQEKIFIPPNLYLIATMNTSDQSLFPMDSAFKRRWDMEYVYINYKDSQISDVIIEGTTDKWKDILQLVNKIIYSELNSEDKQIGQWFIKYKDKGNKKVISAKDFKHKLLSYLYFDVFKHSPEIFNKPYSDLVNSEIKEIIENLKKYTIN